MVSLPLDLQRRARALVFYLYLGDGAIGAGPLLVLHSLAPGAAQIIEQLNGLMDEFPGHVTKVQGTGLLFSAELHPGIEVVGFDGIETWLRKRGLGVIHGGENSLRFTPHFGIRSEEVDLIIDLVRQGIEAFSGRVLQAASA